MTDVKVKKELIKKKSKKTYSRHELHKMTKLRDRWKKPRGTDSKKRRKMKKKGFFPAAGHRTSKNIRFLHPSGLAEILVSNVNDLMKLAGDSKDIAVRIRGTVGKRKRLSIVDAASKKNLKVLNKVAK